MVRNAAHAVILVGLVACTSVTSHEPGAPGQQAVDVPLGPSPLIDDAVRGVAAPELAELLRDHWEWWMRTRPTWATTLGDRRYDDRLPPSSLEDREAVRRETREFLSRARAIDRAALGPDDALTLDLFTESLAAAVAAAVCDFESWTVSPTRNVITGASYLPRQHAIHSRVDADHLLARYRGIAPAVDDQIARGAAAGKLANAESVARTIEMVDRQLAQPVSGWVLMEPIVAAREVLGADAGGFERELSQIVSEEIAPAYRRYRDFLAEHIAPRARSGERVGLVGLPQGEACYAAEIQRYIGLQKTPAELHEIGRREIQRINDEMRALGQKLFGTSELAEILTRLRSDEALYFTSEEEILREAERAVEAARQVMSTAFGILPQADCVVVPVPEYEAPFTTIAYYRPPHYDGSKPGEYFINVHAPHTRPRYELRALSFHEAIPGHHLQIAIAQERGELPAVRKFSASTAFVEGWALYTERLSEELGLYETDLDRMGMLSYDAWRAARLVVDTGVHAMGWSREQAEAYMRDHTALTPGNISNEVDRYIARPGQALAYKIGQLEILRLRAQAQEALGPAFSLAGFHDVVLASGGVSLPVLARQVEAWVAAKRPASAALAP